MACDWILSRLVPYISRPLRIESCTLLIKIIENLELWLTKHDLLSVCSRST